MKEKEEKVMKNTVNAYAEKFKHMRGMRRGVTGVLLVLALVVSCGVFWVLHSDGAAMVNETFCGMEEHSHEETCYEKVFVCGDEETGDHVHGDACYEEQLICDIPEHTHTVACITDETADVETAADWEATLPGNLTGNWADDVVAVAKSQVGYAESETNFRLAEDDGTRQGYTRYGAWYGNAYGDWDAMFVSFCLHYAKLPESAFPEDGGAYAWAVALKEEGLYLDACDQVPGSGDIVFFDQGGNGQADRVGIVEKVDSDSEQIQVIEGDSNDAVQENVYQMEDGIVLAYGMLPEQSETDGQASQDEDSLTAVQDDATREDEAAALTEDTEITDADDDNGIAVIDEAGDEEVYPVDIFKYTGEWDTEDVKALSGAEFVLSKVVTGTDDSTGEENAVTWYAVFEAETVQTSEYGTLYYYTLMDWTENEENATRLLSGDDGFVHIADLAAETTYYMTEKKAPDGYMLSDKVITFLLSVDEGTGVGYVTDDTVTNAGIYKYYDLDDQIITLYIGNEPGAELPKTGGMGTGMYTLLGLLIMGGAAGLLYRNRKQIR